jgi:hypothetical protein
MVDLLISLFGHHRRPWSLKVVVLDDDGLSWSLRSDRQEIADWDKNGPHRSSMQLVMTTLHLNRGSRMD